MERQEKGETLNEEERVKVAMKTMMGLQLAEYERQFEDLPTPASSYVTPSSR